MAWQTPKTNWAAADGVRNTDMNRIEGNILELYDTAQVRTNLTIYVSTTGSDTTGTGTSSSPYRTISKALSTIPRSIHGYNVTINIAAGTYAEDINIKDFNGIISLAGTGTITVNSLIVDNSICVVPSLTISTTSAASSSAGITVINRGVLSTNASITASGATYGISISRSGVCFIEGTLSTTNITTIGMVTSCSKLYAGTLSSVGATTGLNVRRGSIAAYNTTSFDASMQTEFITGTGSRVFAGAQTSIPKY